MTLTLDPAIRHTIVRHSSTSTYIPNFIEIEEFFCGRTDGRTDIFPPLILLGRLLEVDLNINEQRPPLYCLNVIITTRVLLRNYTRILSIANPMSNKYVALSPQAEQQAALTQARGE